MQFEGIPPLPRPNVIRRFIYSATSPWRKWRQRAHARVVEQARQQPQAKFQHLMKTAEGIAEINPAGLHDLVRAILRPLQSEHLLSIAELGRSAHTCVDWNSFFGPVVQRAMWSHTGELLGAELPADKYVVSLVNDTVLPWPWQHDRYITALAMIGQSKELQPRPEEFPRARWKGPWRYDQLNHGVTLWLPWRIGFVWGGNHSITAGILAGEGQLIPSDVYDMAFLFEDMYTDGVRYYCSKTDVPLGLVPNPRVAAVFEIGRMIHMLARK